MILLTRALVATAILTHCILPTMAWAEPGPEAAPSRPSPAPPVPPPAPPSQIDPGIHKQPDNLPPPNPEAVVRPPVVDPKMAIDPEQPKQDAPSPPIPAPPHSRH